MTRCSCDPVYYSGGKPHPDVGGHDPDCPTHGYPNDEWRAGSPIFCLRLLVDKRTGETLSKSEAYERIRKKLGLSSWSAAIPAGEFSDYREETPRETPVRLLRELNWGPLPKLRPLRRCPVRFGQR